MDKKKCTKCGLEKPMEEFYPRGHSTRRLECAECSRAQVRVIRLANREAYNAHRRAHEKLLGEELRAAERERYRRNKQKHAAKRILNKALLESAVVREPCWCAPFSYGSQCCGRIEAHHEDYAKPLDVIWLCQSHHKRLHTRRSVRERRRAARAAATLSID